MKHKHFSWILIACILVAIILVASISWWKLQTHQYNGIDLAIYTQVTWNVFQGNGFDSSIQATNYFGDHVEPLLIIFSPLVALFHSSFPLLFLQTVALFGSAWLLYILAQQFVKPLPSFMLAIGFLCNPIIWNMALFEFHILPFAIPLLLAALFFFEKKRFIPFIVFCLLTVLVREDAAFVVFGLGILALAKRRSWFWWLLPLLISIAWFIGSLAIVDSVRNEGYKFTAYYGWLGESPKEMLATLFTQPVYVLKGILSFGNIILVFALILLFLGLPLFGVMGLIPGILVFAQLIFARFNPELLLETHYLSLLVPVLFYAAILGIKKISTYAHPILTKATTTHTKLSSGIILLLIGYSFLFLGPLIGGSKGYALDPAHAQDRNALLDMIPSDAPVAASYASLPDLSDRENIYSLHYIAFGKKQFSDTPYIPDTTPEYVLLDLNDITFYEYQCSTTGQNNCTPETVTDNMYTFLSDYAIHQIADSWVLLTQKTEESTSIVDSLLIPIGPTNETIREDAESVALIDGAINTTNPLFENELLLRYAAFPNENEMDMQYAFEIETTTKTFMVPLGWLLHSLPEGEKGFLYRMRVPLQKNERPIQARVISRSGYATLNGFRSPIQVVSESNPAGDFIPFSP